MRATNLGSPRDAIKVCYGPANIWIASLNIATKFDPNLLLPGVQNVYVCNFSNARTSAKDGTIKLTHTRRSKFGCSLLAACRLAIENSAEITLQFNPKYSRSFIKLFIAFHSTLSYAIDLN